MNFIPNSYIVGFASGLYLLRKDNEKYAIYNPSTHECKELPYLPIYINRYHGPKFGPFGFYYDSANEDFKVLFIFWEADSNLQTIIYSLRRNSWCRIEGGTCRIFYLLEYEGLLFSGALHWLSIREKEIVAFDIGTEKCRIVPLPDYPYSDYDNYGRDIVELAECLHYMYYNNEAKTYYLWMMKDYGVNNSWTKLLSLPLSYGLGIQLLCYSKNQDEILFIGDTRERKCLFSYDLKKHTTKEIHEDAVTTCDGALIENLVQLSDEHGQTPPDNARIEYLLMLRKWASVMFLCVLDLFVLGIFHVGSGSYARAHSARSQGSKIQF